MAVSIASNIDEKSIIFDSNNIVDNGKWKISKGNVIIDNTILLGAGSEISMKLAYTKSNIIIGQYLKMICSVICNDKTLSTLESHNVSMTVVLKQADDEYNNYYSVYSFYPTYSHETHYKDNYTITDISTDEIIGIEVIITNNENIEVELNDIGIFTSVVMNEKYIQNTIEKHLYENMNFIVPLLEERPDDNDDTIRDGLFMRIPAW